MFNELVMTEEGLIATVQPYIHIILHTTKPIVQIIDIQITIHPLSTDGAIGIYNLLLSQNRSRANPVQVKLQVPEEVKED